MRRIIRKVIRNRLVNTAVRVPMKALLSRSTNEAVRHFLLRMPVVGKFGVALPDGNSIAIYTSEPDLDHIARKLFWWGFESHEAATTAVFYQLARTCGTVFDVGANIGYFSLLAFAANRESHIVAFEPVPEIFECLKSNIKVNHATNVVPVPVAVTDHDGKTLLYVHGGGQSSVKDDFREAAAEIEVPSVTLDSYVEQNDTERVDLIKIDVENGEPLVFEGMKRILERDEPDVICEILGASTEEFLNGFLKGYGYRSYWITDEGLHRRDRILHDDKYQCLNYLFTKSNEMKGVIPQLSGSGG